MRPRAWLFVACAARAVCLGHATPWGAPNVYPSLTDARVGWHALGAVNSTALDGCRAPGRAGWTTAESVRARSDGNCTVASVAVWFNLASANQGTNAALYGLHLAVLGSADGTAWTRLGAAALPPHRDRGRVEVEWTMGTGLTTGQLLRVLVIDRVTINDELPVGTTCAAGDTGTHVVEVYGTPILRRYNSHTVQVTWPGCTGNSDAGGANATNPGGDTGDPFWWSQLNGVRLSLALSAVAVFLLVIYAHARFTTRKARM